MAKYVRCIPFESVKNELATLIARNLELDIANITITNIWPTNQIKMIGYPVSFIDIVAKKENKNVDRNSHQKIMIYESSRLPRKDLRPLLSSLPQSIASETTEEHD